VRNIAFATISVVVLGLVICSSCSPSDQSAGVGPKPDPVRLRAKDRDSAGGSWWRDADVVTEMDLTDEQVERIDAIMSEAKAKAIEFVELERRAATRFHRALSQQQLSPELVDQVSAELEDVLSAKRQIRITRIRALREVMAKEQWDMLWQLSPQSLQVSQVRVFRGPSVYISDGTPVPDFTPSEAAEPSS
jgi:Spy/CpxP family protein refolding chaperone